MPSFTLEEIFGRPLKGACGVASESDVALETICLDVPHSRNVDVATNASYNEVAVDDGRRCYRVAGKQKGTTNDAQLNG